MIIVAGIKILNETKNSILGEAPLQEAVKDIEDIIAEYPKVIGIHDLMIHNYGPRCYIASLHAEVDGSDDIYMLHDMIDNIEKHIQQKLNMLCTIHLDPIDTNDDKVNELKSFLLSVIEEDIGENISVHDFRIVVGSTHTNMIFDIVLPFESKLTADEIVKKINDAVQKRRENHYCVITVDRG
jgi:divalent metal cation (Fe/Co/Zn/Cd) transporter